MAVGEKYEAVIGLEIHAQLATSSKLFCGDAASFGAEPNTHISPITMGHPADPRLQRIIILHAKIISIPIYLKVIKYHNIPLLFVKAVPLAYNYLLVKK
jgi:Asp-tRNA(Asn)/Glu-tRNA(Gln) amidotransferase B subunit